MTVVQVNLLALAVICAILQGVMLWFLNGHLPELIVQKDAIGLALVLSPMGGIVYALRRMAFYQQPVGPHAGGNCCRPCANCPPEGV